MATLHLELDIDSDVHPELYVRLAQIERSPARQEKLRQLASTGLIWEIARLHGPAFSEPEAVAHAPALHAGDDPAARAVDAGSASEHAPRVPDDVPMLVDVVDDAEIDGTSLAAPLLSLVVPPPHDGADGVSRGTSAAGVPLAAAPAEAPVGRTRSARIKRMKDSGLFQNG